VRVELTRSGGLAALQQTIAVDTEELPEQEARHLEDLVEQADIETVAQRSPLRGRGADRFQYDLVVTDAGARHEVTASEDVASAELRALADWLLRHAAGQ
jgi:predicted ArsR family transcriptional regulator